jgi:sugar phosphate isomerase/epimerase
MEVGVIFWAERDALEDIRGCGVDRGQLGILGEIELTPEFAARWKRDLDGFAIDTVICAFLGDNYTDIPTIQQTVGLIPDSTRAARESRIMEVSDFAAALGVKSIGCHIGFVPEDRTDPDYIHVRDSVRRICDHLSTHGQTFALETGQETAEALLRFIDDVGRGNLKVNFDPANMLLYGTGEPIAAFEVLAKHVVSVHAKDGKWPPANPPGALGTEQEWGHGLVNVPEFMKTLERCGFTGNIFVERETDQKEQRLIDIRNAVLLTRRYI